MNCDMKMVKKKYVGETKRKLHLRVKEHRSETEKVSKGTNYTRDKKKPTPTSSHQQAINGVLQMDI